MNTVYKFRQHGEVTPDTYKRRVTVVRRLTLGALALIMGVSVLYAPMLWDVYKESSHKTSTSAEEIGVKMGEGYFVPRVK